MWMTVSRSRGAKCIALHESIKHVCKIMHSNCKQMKFKQMKQDAEDALCWKHYLTEGWSSKHVLIGEDMNLSSSLQLTFQHENWHLNPLKLDRSWLKRSDCYPNACRIRLSLRNIDLVLYLPDLCLAAVSVPTIILLEVWGKSAKSKQVNVSKLAFAKRSLLLLSALLLLEGLRIFPWTGPSDILPVFKGFIFYFL